MKPPLIKGNLASSVEADDSAEDTESPDSEPGEAADPFSQAAEIAFEAAQDGDKESFTDALKNAIHQCIDEYQGGPPMKKKPVLSLKLGGKG